MASTSMSESTKHIALCNHAFAGRLHCQQHSTDTFFLLGSLTCPPSSSAMLFTPAPAAGSTAVSSASPWV